MDSLVQPPPPLRVLRRHPARRTGDGLLRSQPETSRRLSPQIGKSPDMPGRFIQRYIAIKLYHPDDVDVDVDADGGVRRRAETINRSLQTWHHRAVRLVAHQSCVWPTQGTKQGCRMKAGSRAKRALVARSRSRHGLRPGKTVCASTIALAIFSGTPNQEESRAQLLLRHSFRRRLLNDSMYPLFHGVPGGMDNPTLPAQNCCSAWETNSGPLSMRSTFGGPPAAANTDSSSATSRSAVIQRSTR
jgi:hypothetical protein